MKATQEISNTNYFKATMRRQESVLKLSQIVWPHGSDDKQMLQYSTDVFKLSAYKVWEPQFLHVFLQNRTWVCNFEIRNDTEGFIFIQNPKKEVCIPKILYVHLVLKTHSKVLSLKLIPIIFHLHKFQLKTLSGWGGGGERNYFHSKRNLRCSHKTHLSILYQYSHLLLNTTINEKLAVLHFISQLFAIDSIVNSRNLSSHPRNHVLWKLWG